MHRNTGGPGVNGITEGVIWKQLLLFFYPLLIGTFFETLYSTVDAIVVGQYAGKLALSAVGGSSAILINLIVGFFIGVASGSTVVIAQRFGAKDDEGVSRTVHSSIAIAVIGGAAITLILLFVAPNVLQAMKTPAETLELSKTYLSVVSLGMIPVMIFNMCSGILRAIGDSKTPTYVLIVCCIINIGLDLLFVRVFDWNVAGAAAATIIAQAVSAVILLVILARDRGPCRLYFSRIRLYGEYVKKILYIGIPSGIRATMYSISNVFIQVGINELGTNSVAAWTAYSKIDLIYWMIISSLGTALTTFTGQNFGARKFDRIRSGIKQAVVMMIIATVAYNALLLPTCGYIFRLFTSDGAVLDIAVNICRIMFPSFFLFIAIELISSALIGMGDSIAPTVMTTVGVCGTRILWLMLVLPVWHTMASILTSYPLSWGITSIAFVLYYVLRVRKRVLNAGRKPAPELE